MRPLAGALCALLLTGCGSLGAAPAPSTGTTPRPQPPPTATAVIRAFATAYINWSARTVADDMRALAAASIAQARAAMELAAAGAARDYELHRSGVANSGTVEAVSPLPGGRDQYVVVTREQTTAANSTAYQGLRPAWHVTLATVAQVGRAQWAVSGWQPES